MKQMANAQKNNKQLFGLTVTGIAIASLLLIISTYIGKYTVSEYVYYAVYFFIGPPILLCLWFPDFVVYPATFFYFIVLCVLIGINKKQRIAVLIILLVVHMGSVFFFVKHMHTTFSPLSKINWQNVLQAK